MNEEAQQQKTTRKASIKSSVVRDYLKSRKIKNEVKNPYTGEVSPYVQFVQAQKQIRVARYDTKTGAIKTKILRGLPASGHKLLWNDYSYDTAVSMSKKSRKATAKRKRQEYTEFEDDGTSLEGKSAGTFIHDRLDKFMKMKKEDFAKDFGKMPEIGNSIVTVLLGNKIYPIDSEVAVCDATETIGTKIDLVASDGNGSIIYLIELKTGKSDFNLSQLIDEERYLMIKGGNSVAKPLKSNPKNHAKLQIAMSAFLFDHTYGIEVKKLKCIVIKASSATQIKIVDISSKFISEQAHPRLQYMLRQLHENK